MKGAKAISTGRKAQWLEVRGRVTAFSVAPPPPFSHRLMLPLPVLLQLLEPITEIIPTETARFGFAAATAAPPPRCEAGHAMAVSSYSRGAYRSGFVCDQV